MSISGSNVVHWKLRVEDEWSINVESISLIVSLGWWLWCILNINDRPLLVQTVVLWISNNVLSLNILSLVDVEDLTLDIDDVCSYVFEELPPVRVGTLDINVLSTTIADDMKSIGCCSSGSNCLGLPVEEPLLRCSTVWYLND